MSCTAAPTRIPATAMLSSKKAAAKRKVKADLPEASRKRSKMEARTIDDLPWKTLMRPSQAGILEDDGILMFEEVEGVDVEYEDTDVGKVAKFNFKPKDTNRAVFKDPESHQDENEHDSSEANSDIEESSDDEPFDTAKLLPKWSAHQLHPVLLRSLLTNKFETPTPIQACTLPAAMKGKDVIGVAETGSGKTLAFGLPILHHLLNQPKSRSRKRKRELKALILAPTRELALQVMTHLKAGVAILDETGKTGIDGRASGETSKAGASLKKPPRVSISAIVGGMSAQKQRRVLDRGVDIIVATPGRLWDLLGEDDALARQLKSLKFLVLDEADRMIETGHFAELDNIIRLTMRQTESETDPEFGDELGATVKAADPTEPSVDHQMQTFVFSATLSKDLQKNLKKNKKRSFSKKKPASTMEELLLKLDFRDPEPEVIDLSPEGGVVSTLKQSQVECLSADKDVYLYYFLLRYPGRSLIFLSSIDGIRRLLPLIELLKLKAFPLHSQLQQKQRLKNLDRFRSTPNSILLATDVAARGLDIPSVDHVIHYQIPRSADVYIHRNGRTARASRLGFSLLMCAPDEKRVLRALLGSLRNDTANDIPDMPIELDLLDKLKARVQVARKIDTAQHKVKKENHDRNWLKETAEAMELELDSDFAGSSDEGTSKTRQNKTSDAKTAALKAELKQLLAQPLIAKGISKRYITSGAREIVNELIDGGSHRAMLGFKQNDAGSDLTSATKNAKPRNVGALKVTKTK